MSDFKQKMAKQVLEEKEAKIKQEMNRYDTAIKRLEKIGDTENTFLKLTKFFFSCKDGLSLFFVYILFSQLIRCFLYPYIHNFVLEGVLSFGLPSLILVLLIYWNISVKWLDNYINQLLYKEILFLERRKKSIGENNENRI
ncbi:hypothetical protein [Enterococcus faecium]|uniref:hypothetical protein n=1 Tax=Enterococcus faecium TaxID=1352 RepID=UPI00081326D6|nr:hypothetical protein [Enterococcus faecium]